MKILVLQLARLGDIFTTWPSLRALKRQNPSAEIHVVCRERFKEAFTGLEVIDQLHVLPTKAILSPTLQEELDLEASIAELSAWTAPLAAHSFDRIYNLTYSPFSSYLTKELVCETTEVFGYTRFDDGFLSVPDDTSAYFSAQVGVGRHNRIHLADLFAMMMDMDLIESDWNPPSFIAEGIAKRPQQIAIHMGASQTSKMYPIAHWKRLVAELLRKTTYELVLIGSFDETDMSDFIMKSFPEEPRIVNQVAQCTLKETFLIIAESGLLIGADSAPIHMASLIGTKTLNISSLNVNFWETGPRAAGSYVCLNDPKAPVAPEAVSAIADCMILGDDSQLKNAFLKNDVQMAAVTPAVPSYEPLYPDRTWDWEMLKAIYLGALFPEVSDSLTVQGFARLYEANDLILQQIEFLKDKGAHDTHLSIMARGEEMIETISQMAPALQTLVRWYQTEKLRLGPEEFALVLEKTEVIHLKLAQILLLYLVDDSQEVTDDPATIQEGYIRETDPAQ